MIEQESNNVCDNSKPIELVIIHEIDPKSKSNSTIVEDMFLVQKRDVKRQKLINRENLVNIFQLNIEKREKKKKFLNINSTMQISNQNILSWPSLGFIFLNLCLMLNCFWIRSRTIRQHIRIFLASLLDLNVTYISTLIVFQWFPCIKTIFLYHFLNKQINILAQYVQYSLVWNQPFKSECFFMAFCITGIILTLLRKKYYPIFDEVEDCFQVPQLFRWLSKFFHFLNIVLFRKRRRYRRRNVGNIGAGGTGNLSQIDEIQIGEEIFSGEDEDEHLEDLDFDPSEDIDRMLIERLFAVPNLWLHTELISNDYIEKLPVWNYQESILDCNQNLMIAESSYQSSSSDEDHLNLKEEFEETETETCCIQNSFCFESTTDESILKKEKYIESNQSPSTSKKKFIENVIHNHLKSSIRKKIEKKQRNMIQKRSKRIENSKNTTVDQSCSMKPRYMIDLHECTVCLDPYENDQSIMGLPCGHNYHYECIGEWLTRGNHCCPICRWPSYRFRHPRQQFKLVTS